MFDKWFYTHRGRKCGPVTVEELNRLAETGGLDSRDRIWRVMEDRRDAVEAGTVLIFFLAGGQPKEAPPEPPPAPAPDWLGDVADARAADEPPAPSGGAAPEWLEDVRRLENPSGES